MTFLETTIALIILRCDNYLEQNGISDSLFPFPSLKRLVSSLTDEDLNSWAASDEEEEPSDIQIIRYHKLLSLLGDSLIMQSFLDLHAALFSFPEFGAYLTEYFGYFVNIHLACLLEGTDFPNEEEIYAYVEAAGRICYTDLTAFPLQYAEFRLDERVMGYLFGSDAIGAANGDTVAGASAGASIFGDVFNVERIVGDAKKIYDMTIAFRKKIKDRNDPQYREAQAEELQNLDVGTVVKDIMKYADTVLELI